jgi:hypothetical protein
MYRVGWRIERGLIVPTATLGSKGVNKKKFFGLITTFHRITKVRKVLLYNTITHDVIFCCIERLQQACRSPATPQDHQRLLLRVEWQLRARVTCPLRRVVKSACTTDEGDKGDTAEGLKEASPFRLLIRRWRSRRYVRLDKESKRLVLGITGKAYGSGTGRWRRWSRQVPVEKAGITVCQPPGMHERPGDDHCEDNGQT